MTDIEILFDETELNDLTLDNRMGLAPMTRISAIADGRATAEMASYYRKFADGGFSVLITEGIYTDTAYSQGYENQPGLVTQEHVESWRDVTSAVHDAGTPMVAQLMHAGAQTQRNPHVEDGETLAPSPVKPSGEMSDLYGGSGEFPTPQEATADELADAREGFVAAAENARDAGFDGVEVHAANGYLLNEFLAADHNEREDEYGGSVEAQARYPAEVVKAVDDATPDEFVVGVRVSQTMVSDSEYRWPEGEDAAETYFGAFSDAGADYIHVTEPDITEPAFDDNGPTLAEAAVEYADTTVIANGGLDDPEAAAQVVEAGADLVTLATGALANHDWPRRVQEGEPLDDLDFKKILTPFATIKEAETPKAAD
jgi:2,4-dienoyl-CoA reductase-like NADH-dependent reductase (Old Yellow Enzyme family)